MLCRHAIACSYSKKRNMKTKPRNIIDNINNVIVGSNTLLNHILREMEKKESVNLGLSTQMRKKFQEGRGT